MGQDEVFQFLKRERLCGNNKYFTVFEIRKLLNSNKKIYNQVKQLFNYDILEAKGTPFLDKRYRVKKKYLL